MERWVMSEVFFASARMKREGLNMGISRDASPESVLNKVSVLLERAGLADTIKKGDLVAIKIHFGSIGGFRYIRPPFVRKVVDAVKSCGGKPFVTDTWGLRHLEDAIYNGFSYATLGAPILPNNGIKENDYRVVKVDGGIHLKEVKVAGNIYDADALINFAHTTFNANIGLAALMKNLALGCTTLDTRMDHLHKRATSEANGKQIFAETMVDIVRAVLSNKQGKVMHLSYLMDITEHCGCPPYSNTPIIPDLGVSASQDLVATEALNVDLINKAPTAPNSTAEQFDLEPGDDKFNAINGGNPWVMIKTLEQFGIGNSKYRMIEV